MTSKASPKLSRISPRAKGNLSALVRMGLEIALCVLAALLVLGVVLWLLS